VAVTESKMRLGIQPTGWTNDDFQEIGNGTPYQHILDETADEGFAGGSTGHNYPTHVPSLLQALLKRGSVKTDLVIVATWAGTRFTTSTDVEAAFREFTDQVAFLKAVGAEDVVVAELGGAVNQLRTKAVLTDRPRLNEPQWRLLTSQLDRAGRYADERKLRLSYHPHVGTGVMTLEETERLLDSTDPKTVGLCLDTAHLCYGGCSQYQLEQLTAKYARRIKHVHLKNVREEVLSTAKADHYSFYEAIEAGIFTVPGDQEGVVLDLGRILKILKDAGYCHWLIVEAEQDPAKPDPVRKKMVKPVEYAHMARRFLTEHLGY
jgi:inosose dehydratase